MVPSSPLSGCLSSVADTLSCFSSSLPCVPSGSPRRLSVHVFFGRCLPVDSPDLTSTYLHPSAVSLTVPLTLVSPPLCSPQLRGRVEGLHEEQKPGSLLPGEADDATPLITAGDLPAQTSAEDPQVPPASPGTASSTAFSRGPGALLFLGALTC